MYPGGVAKERRKPEEEATATGDLDMTIERDGEVPVGVQLAWVLRARIQERRLQPGERLPGLRELAQAAGVNINTARAAYQRLEQGSLIETRQGSGSYVADSSRRNSQVTVIAAGAARKARRAGVDPREVAAALYVSSSPLNEIEQTAAHRRALLRVQITALATALGEIESTYPGLASALQTRGPRAGPKMLNAAELERVRADLLRRLAAVQAAVDALSGEDHAEGPRPQPARSPQRKRSHKRAISPAPARA